MARSDYKFTDPSFPHFLTFTVIEWIPLFNTAELASILIDSLNYLINKERILLFSYVIMPDHMHLIAKAENSSKEIQSFKSFTAKQIISSLKLNNQVEILNKLSINQKNHKTQSTHQLWQEGSHPQMIQNVEMMRKKLEYIHMNPVKAGLIDAAEEWENSSAVDYSGILGRVPISKNW